MLAVSWGGGGGGSHTVPSSCLQFWNKAPSIFKSATACPWNLSCVSILWLFFWDQKKENWVFWGKLSAFKGLMWLGQCHLDDLPLWGQLWHITWPHHGSKIHHLHNSKDYAGVCTLGREGEIWWTILEFHLSQHLMWFVSSVRCFHLLLINEPGLHSTKQLYIYFFISGNLPCCPEFAFYRNIPAITECIYFLLRDDGGDPAQCISQESQELGLKELEIVQVMQLSGASCYGEESWPTLIASIEIQPGKQDPSANSEGPKDDQNLRWRPRAGAW